MKLEIVTALTAGLLLGLAGSAVFDGPESTVPSTKPAADTALERAAPEVPDPADMPAAPNPDTLQQAQVQKAVTSAVREAGRMGGEASAAVAAEGWESIATAGSTGTFRMWSTSKPIAAVALLLLDAQAAAEESPGAVSPEMEDALVRSSNCGMRKLVIDLQEESGGKQGAADWFEYVTDRSGVRSDTLSTAQYEPLGDDSCDAYLKDLGTRTDGRSWLFGTAEWTTSDAASFALALADGRLGPSGEVVREEMRMPKEASPDEGSEDSVKTDLNWGAGMVFPEDWKPAYKSGWGGSQDGDYLASQIVSIDVEGQPIGISVMFSPDEQPVDDAVGQGNEDEAIEAMLARIRDALQAGGSQ